MAATLPNGQTTIDDVTPATVSIIMVPFPAQGHLNQMLQLSCLISSYGVPVHFVGPAIHNRQAKVRATALNPAEVACIHFHDLPIPPFLSPPPNPNSASKFPTQLQPAWDATLSLRGPLTDYMKSMAEKHTRVIVIHDPLTSILTHDIVSIPNAESYGFVCIAAIVNLILHFELKGKPLPFKDLQKLPPILSCISDEHVQFLGLQRESFNLRAGNIYNTCRLIEPVYFELIEKEQAVPCWAIGPVFPPKKQFSSSSSMERHECLQWLDKQDMDSVIYVSFGTTTSLSDEEITELGLGLEKSGQKFLWVLRDADKADIFDGDVRSVKLPLGFEERLKEKGMVIRDWAPQPEILAHPAVGGFMSHCGWNSCIESMTAGVPIAAWPMHSDQPANAYLITEVLRMGLLVREWTAEGEVVRAETVESAVRRLMAEDEGEEMRKKAKELAAVVAEATEESGASRREMDAFITHITRPGDPEPHGSGCGSVGVGAATTV